MQFDKNAERRNKLAALKHRKARFDDDPVLILDDNEPLLKPAQLPAGDQADPDLPAAQDAFIDAMRVLDPVQSGVDRVHADVDRVRSGVDRVHADVDRVHADVERVLERVHTETHHIQKIAEDFMRSEDADNIDRVVAENAQMVPSALRASIHDIEEAQETRLMDIDALFESYTACFMQFAGTFGVFVRESSKRGKDFLQEAAVAAGKLQGNHPFLKSTFFTKDKAKWTVAAVKVMSGAAGIFKAKPKRALDAPEVELKDIDVADVDSRLVMLAYEYMQIRDKAAVGGGLGQDANPKSQAALRYELWMTARFPGWWNNVKADYFLAGMSRKVSVSSEIFMMELLYVVFNRIVVKLGVIADDWRDGDEIKGAGAVDRITTDVRQEIAELFNVTLDHMKLRVVNSNWYLGQMLGCTAASAALLTVFLLSFNPPGVLAAMSFVNNVGLDSYAQFMQQLQARRVDGNVAGMITSMATFYSAAESSTFFKLMLEFPEHGLKYAVAVRRAAKKKELKWVNGGGRPMWLIDAALAATVVACAVLGSF